MKMKMMKIAKKKMNIHIEIMIMRLINDLSSTKETINLH